MVDLNFLFKSVFVAIWNVTKNIRVVAWKGLRIYRRLPRASFPYCVDCWKDRERLWYDWYFCHATVSQRHTLRYRLFIAKKCWYHIRSFNNLNIRRCIYIYICIYIALLIWEEHTCRYINKYIINSSNLYWVELRNFS